MALEAADEAVDGLTPPGPSRSQKIVMELAEFVTGLCRTPTLSLGCTLPAYLDPVAGPGFKLKSCRKFCRKAPK